MINDYGEDRAAIWDDYVKAGGEPHRIVRHMFVDYSRYYEAKLIRKWFFEAGVALKDITVLDYGCGVGDYGILLLREGAKEVMFYDFPRSTNFVNYRLQNEKLKNGFAISGDDITLVAYPYDLIIFGEVLEHLLNPYELLADVVENNVKYIFTSSYPYRSDDANDPYWDNPDHSKSAFDQMPLCRALLENNYDYIKFDGELRLWHKK